MPNALLPAKAQWAHFRQQLHLPLLVHSLFLLAGRFGSTALIFVFWILAARNIPADGVGLAVSANSAISVLVLLIDLGLSSGIVRFVPQNHNDGVKLLNAILAVAWCASLLAAVIFLVGLPLFSPGLLILRQTATISAAFVLAVAALNLLNLHSAALLTQRRSDFSFWRYNLAAAGSLLAFLVFGRWMGGFAGVFIAYNLPNMLLLVVSSAFILPRFFPGVRAWGHFDREAALRLRRYAGANHLATLFWELPIIGLPLLATNLTSAQAAAYFYMPWIIGNTVLAIPQMISTSLFVEGSHQSKAVGQLGRKAAWLMLLLIGPSVLALWFGGEFVLHILGKDYVNVQLLRLILLSSLPFTLNTLMFTYFRVTLRLKMLVLHSGLAAFSIFTLAWNLTPTQGEWGLALSWLAGHTLSAGVVGGLLVVKRLTQKAK